MAGETMVEWLRDIEGFQGLLMLSNDETGTTHVISFWESKEVAERSRVARLKLRDRITSTVSVEVQETGGLRGLVRRPEARVRSETRRAHPCARRPAAPRLRRCASSAVRGAP